MLQSVKIARRQSEIRQELATLAAKPEPTEDETLSMETLDAEYRTNETRYRAALVGEDEERRAAKDDFESREGSEWAELVAGFEVRQVALSIDEGRALDGRTAEVVEELRSQGGYRGLPVPWEALETRSTVSTGTPDPKTTAPIIDRLFAESVAARMGCRMVNVGSGEIEYPVTTSAVSASWAATEGGNIGDPVAYTTVDRPMKPDNTLGVRMAISRKTLKQSGAALEAAVRRDMNGAIGEAMDAAVFQGSGSNGQPTGVLNLTVTPAITSTDVSAIASYSIFRDAVRRMMDANAAMNPSAARLLIRPLTWSVLDDALISGTSDTEWDRFTRRFSAANVVISDNALPASEPEDATDKGAHTCLLTAVTGGVPPIFCATWGAIDLVRDAYTDAASGGLRLTALSTMDVTVSRPQQLEILTNVQDRA
ncbi:MAG: phage major capsid protein [Pseudomonadota bacterium]